MPLLTLVGLVGKVFRNAENPPASPGSFPHCGKPSQRRRETFRTGGNLPGVLGRFSALRETLPACSGSFPHGGKPYLS